MSNELRGDRVNDADIAVESGDLTGATKAYKWRLNGIAILDADAAAMRAKESGEYNVSVEWQFGGVGPPVTCDTSIYVEAPLSDLDISITDAEATVISARVGWNGKLGGFTGVLWVGAMYQDIAQVLDLPLDVGDDILLVSIDQETQEPLNYVVGGQWDINRSFSVLAELGFGERKSEMLNLTYRF